MPVLDHRPHGPVPVPYAILIYGHLGALVLPAFLALVPQRHGADTVLTGLPDRSALDGVLAEIGHSASTSSRVRQHAPQRISPKSDDSRSP